MTDIYLTAHALNLVLDMKALFIFYSSSHSFLTRGYNIVIDDRARNIVLVLIDVNNRLIQFGQLGPKSPRCRRLPG